MPLRWDRILDRLWLALAGGATLALALHAGAQLGRRAWPVGEAVLAARAAAAGDAPRTLALQAPALQALALQALAPRPVCRAPGPDR